MSPELKALYGKAAEFFVPRDPSGKPLTVAGTTAEGVTYYQDSRGNLVNSRGQTMVGQTLRADQKGLHLAASSPEPEETWGDWFSSQPAIIGEAGKSLLRGMFAGVVGAAHLSKMSADAMAAPTSALMGAIGDAVGVPKEYTSEKALGSLNPMKSPMEWVSKLGEEALKLFEPTPGGPHVRSKAYARHLLGVSDEAGALEWIWALGAGDAPLGDKAGAVVTNLGIEAPYLAGMEIMAQILGPGGAMSGQVKRGAGVAYNEASLLGGSMKPTTLPGPVEEFTGFAHTLGVPGGLTWEGAMKVPGLRNLADKLGKPVFEEMAIWGSINSAQLMSETVSRDLMHGKSGAEAVANGLVAASLGYVVGMGFGLGAITLTGGLAAGAGATAGATQQKAAEMVLASTNALRNWKGREAAGKSVLAAINKMADKYPGMGKVRDRLVARVLQYASEASQFTQAIRENVFRENTSRAILERSEELKGQASIFRETAQTRVKEVQEAEAYLESAQFGIEQLEQANPALPAAAQALRTIEETFAPFNKAENSRLLASQGAAKGMSQEQIAGNIKKWEQEVLPRMGLKDMADFKKAYAKAKKDYEKELAEFSNNHGADPQVTAEYMKRAQAADQARVSLEARKSDPAYTNAADLENSATIFEQMASELATRAEAIRGGVLPAQPPAAQPPTPGPSQAQNLTLFEQGLESVIAAGLSGDPVKSPLAFQTTRRLRELLESDSGSVLNQVENVLGSIDREIAELQDIVKDPLEKSGKAPRLPSKSREAVDPDYAQKKADKEAELAIWQRDELPKLKKEREAHEARLRSLSTQKMVLSRARDEMIKTSTLASPQSPLQRVLEGKASELKADLEKEAVDAGFPGGIKDIVGLLEQKTVSPNVVHKSLYTRDRDRVVGKAPPRDLSKEDRRKALGKPPRRGSKQRAAWDARAAQFDAQKKAVRDAHAAWQKREAQYRAKVDEIKESGRYVLLQNVPREWVNSKATKVSGDIHEPGTPIILKEGTNGELAILDGNIRFQGATPDQPIRAWVPKKALEKMLRERASGTDPNSPKRLGDYLFPREEVKTTVIPGTPGAYKVGTVDGAEVIPHPSLHPDAPARASRLEAETDRYISEGPTPEFDAYQNRLAAQAEALAKSKGIDYSDFDAVSPIWDEVDAQNTFSAEDLRFAREALEQGTSYPWDMTLSSWERNYARVSGKPWADSPYSKAAQDPNVSKQDVMAMMLADMEGAPVTVDGVTHYPAGKAPAEVYTPEVPATTQTATTTHRFDPMAEAKEWFDNLSPDEKTNLLEQEFHALTQAFLEAEMPSLKAYRTLMNLDVPGQTPPSGLSPEGEKMAGDLKYLNDELEVLRADMTALHNSSPTTVGAMMMKSFYTLENWANKVSTSRRVADHISTNFRRKLIDSLGLTPKPRPTPSPQPGRLHPSMLDTAKDKFIRAIDEDPYTKVELPVALRERLVDAIESLSTTPDQMRSLLKDYPALRDTLGTYFQMIQQWEKLKLLSPEMESFFRRDVFFHSYPTLREVFKRVSSDNKVNKIPFTRLVSETMRKIDTLAKAREEHGRAMEIVTKGSWDKMPNAPRTEAGKAERFLNISDGERARILGVDLDTDEGRKAVNRAIIGLALKNPVTDPAVMIANQIKAVYMADATRQLLKDLSNAAIPGMHALNPATGRPYSVVEYFPSTTGQGTAVPAVPSLKPGMSINEPGGSPVRGDQPVARYISLAGAEFGMNPRTKITIGGRQIEAKDLYIHPDVAEMIQKRFLSKGSEFGDAWAGFSELIRGGQLIGAPMAHATNILTDHWISLGADALLGVVTGRHGVGTAVKRIATAPFDAVGMGLAGEKMGGDIRLFMDAQLHGANFEVWDAAVRTAADAANKWIEAEMGVGTVEEGSKLGKLFNRMTEKHDSPMAWWNAQRDVHATMGTRAEKAGHTAEMLLNGGLNLDYWGNNYMVFEPIKQSMLAAYHYWTAVHWKDMGQKLIAQGHSPATALGLCKESSAKYVNTISGTLKQSVDPAWFRKAVYSPLGVPATGIVGMTAPGWGRSTINALLTPLDRILEWGGAKAGQENWGRLAMEGAISPEYRKYIRARWEATLLFGMAGSWASMQVYNMMTTGGLPTITHPDPTQRNRIQHGKVSYQWPFVGMYRDLMKQLDSGLAMDTDKALRAAFTDKISPFPVKMGVEAIQNNSAVFRGGGTKQPIRNPYGNPLGQAVDTSKYLLARSMSGPLESIGIEDPTGSAEITFGSPKWLLQAVFGVRVSDYQFAPGARGRIEGPESFYEQALNREIKPLIRKARGGDQDAFREALEKAMIEGYPVEGKHQELLGDRYRMSEETVRSLVLSMAAPDIHYMDGLNPQETAAYLIDLGRYYDRQKKIGQAELIRKTLEEETK